MLKPNVTYIRRPTNARHVLHSGNVTATLARGNRLLAVTAHESSAATAAAAADVGDAEKASVMYGTGSSVKSRRRLGNQTFSVVLYVRLVLRSCCRTATERRQRGSSAVQYSNFRRSRILCSHLS